MGLTSIPPQKTTTIGPPLWLLAELTYRCPLHCVFCYNPVDFALQQDELSTDDWLRVLREGREMGAVQLGLSGVSHWFATTSNRSSPRPPGSVTTPTCSPRVSA